MHTTASPFVFWGIVALAVVMAVVLAVAVGRALSPARKPLAFVVVGAWLALTATVALSGVLANFDARPPPMAVLFVATIAAGVALGLSRIGSTLAARVPLFALVGAQSFRLPLEVVMHEAAVEGTMPHAMSFSGYNFDIVTGALALVCALLLRRAGARARPVAIVFDIVGIATLTGIAVISFAASPMVRAFGDDAAHVNTWVAYFPFVWLPTVLVLFAIAGHVVLTRALLSSAAR
jgi:hypothetical protein